MEQRQSINRVVFVQIYLNSTLFTSPSAHCSAKPVSPQESGSLWGPFLTSHGIYPRMGPSPTMTSVGRVWGVGCSGVCGVILQLPLVFPAVENPWVFVPAPRAQPLSLDPSVVRHSPVPSSARMEINGELNGWRILALIPLPVLGEGEVHCLSISPCCDKSLRSCFAAAHCEEHAKTVSRVQRYSTAHGSSHWERSQLQRLPGTPSWKAISWHRHNQTPIVPWYRIHHLTATALLSGSSSCVSPKGN